MAKKDLDLRLDTDVSQQPAAPTASATKKSGKDPKKNNKAKSNQPSFGARLKKFFREIISELKKVEWPPFKRTKNNPGVLANTSTVLVVVVFFLVIITAVDLGLAALLRLLVS